MPSKNIHVNNEKEVDHDENLSIDEHASIKEESSKLKMKSTEEEICEVILCRLGPLKDNNSSKSHEAFSVKMVDPQVLNSGGRSSNSNQGAIGSTSTANDHTTVNFITEAISKEVVQGSDKESDSKQRSSSACLFGDYSEDEDKYKGVNMEPQKPEVEAMPSADKSINPSEPSNTAQETLPQGSSGLRLRSTAQGIISEFYVFYMKYYLIALLLCSEYENTKARS